METLFERLVNNKTRESHPTEDFLWQLSYSLLKYLSKFRNEESKLKLLSFQNILILADGSLRFVAEKVVRCVSTNPSVPETIGKQE